jgi:hypothetical protein
MMAGVILTVTAEQTKERIHACQCDMSVSDKPSVRLYDNGQTLWPSTPFTKRNALRPDNFKTGHTSWEFIVIGCKRELGLGIEANAFDKIPSKRRIS